MATLISCSNQETKISDTAPIQNTELSESSISSTAESQETIETANTEHVSDATKEEGQASVDSFREENIWVRIRDGLSLNFIDTFPPHAVKRVEAYKKELLRNPDFVTKLTSKAEPYLYYVVEQLEQNGVPVEFAMLPMVESSYDPFAYSPSRAAGLWQFIPGTGNLYDLKSNWWKDKRRDVVASTDAAIEYLLYLNKMFDGDWLLTAAAYNGGPGTVKRAIRKNNKRNHPTDYWSLKLPKETMRYVPKLLVWRDLILNQYSDEVSFHPIKNQAHFVAVDVNSQIDLAEVADLAEVDIDVVYQLNPAYSRWATDPETVPFQLLLPVDKADAFAGKLAQIPANERVTWKRYIVKKNDTLSGIAKRFHTTTAIIKQTNNLKNNNIRLNSALLIPSASRNAEFYSASQIQRTEKLHKSTRKNKQRIHHKVAAGESWWSISRRYNVDVRDLARWNKMSHKDTLSINKKLIVWLAKNKTLPSSQTRKVFYKVRSGDSLASIANKFKILVSDIKRWNASANNRYIQPGQKLTLHLAITQR